MANIQINELTAAGSSADTDQFVIENASNQTRKVTLLQIWTRLVAKITDLTAAGSAADTDEIPAYTASGARKLTLSQIFTAFLASARTFLGTVTINKTAESSAAETLQVWTVSDDATGKFEVRNAVTTDATFLPMLRGTAAGTNTAMYVYGLCTTDTGTNPAFLVDGRTVGGAALSTRPIAGVNNLGTRVMTLWPAGLMIGSGTSTAAAAKLEVQDTKSQVLFGTSAGQAGLFADNAGARFTYGVKYTGSAWETLQATGSVIQAGLAQIIFYTSAGTVGAAPTFTEQARLTTTGLGVKTTPLCALTVGSGHALFTGASAPTSGTGVAVSHNGTTGVVESYDFATPAYKDLTLRGAVVRLNSSGTDIAVVNTTKMQLARAIQLANYTTATRPAAGSIGAGGAIYDTTLSKPVFSDGAAYKDAAGAAA